MAAIDQASLRIVKTARQVAPLVLRIALALPFLRSGLTRWDGFLSLSPGTRFLFEEQFRLHIFGGEYALPAPDRLALLTAVAEIVLPVLLIVGLGTRLAALGLLVMTGVIQLVFPDGWANFHLYWAALALDLIARGPGAISIDRWICGAIARFRPSRATC
ncbi:MAG: DoxX family protein [Pararhizobium sp.]